uniref:Uncharacterized protein n=1 Tax=Solanum lycopersicum TaxID=4081 RepID=A0A3Q7GUQ8_SOLLC
MFSWVTNWWNTRIKDYSETHLEEFHIPIEDCPFFIIGLTSPSGNFQTNNFNKIFQFLILLCSTLCIPLSVEYIKCTNMAIIEFLIFLITIFVSPECFSLCSYLLSGYTKKDVQSNEATMKYLLMGGQALLFWFMVSFGYMVHPREILSFKKYLIALIFITLGIGLKLSPAPSHQWTPDIYEGVRFVREIPTYLSISKIFGFFKTPWTCRREILSPHGPIQNFYFLQVLYYG